MKLVNVQFDRVFDVQRRHRGRSWKESRYTDFSFEAAGRKVFAASVVGHPAIPVSQALAVVLRREGDWSTIEGWKNLQTGQVDVVNARSVLIGVPLMGVAASVMMLPFLLVHDPLATSTETVMRWVLTFCPAVFALIGARRGWQRVKAAELLAAEGRDG